MRPRLLAPSVFSGFLVVAGLLCVSACKVESGPDMSTDSFGDATQTESGAGTNGDELEESDSGNDCPDDGCLDFAMGGTAEGSGGGDCEAPEHVPCDDGDPDLINALGLNCPGELQFEVGSWGSSEAFGTLTAFGDTTDYNPRELSLIHI